MAPDSRSLDDLHEKAEQLYATFADYRKPPVEACVDTLGAPIPHSAWIAWNKPLRDYTSDEAGSFGHYSLCCHIDRDEYSRWFKFWLPRLLQGIASQDFACGIFDQVFLVECFGKSSWPDWPEVEVNAVRNWCIAWLDLWLSGKSPRMPQDPSAEWTRPGTFGLDVMGGPIEFAIGLGLDPVPHLRQAMESMSPASARVIASVANYYTDPFIMQNELDNAGAPGVTLRRELARWLLHPSTASRLESAYFKFMETDSSAAADVSSALESLANLRGMYTNRPQGWPEWLALC